MVVGIREMHGATTGKAALVVLIPFALVLLVAVVVLVAAGIVFYNQGQGMVGGFDASMSCPIATYS